MRQPCRGEGEYSTKKGTKQAGFLGEFGWTKSHVGFWQAAVPNRVRSDPPGPTVSTDDPAAPGVVNLLPLGTISLKPWISRLRFRTPLSLTWRGARAGVNPRFPLTGQNNRGQAGGPAPKAIELSYSYRF